MEPIDAAAQCLDSLISEIASYDETIRSEADTRLKVIDRVLCEVLGWPLGQIFTEESSGDGYLDYKLNVDGRARLVVEAKRDGRDLGIGTRAAGRAFRLDGPVFFEAAVKQGIDQAIRYCGQKNAELACVTNGREWLVFRGSRVGDGRDTTEGMAFVFPSLDAVRSKFTLFYDLLSYEAASGYRFRAHFQEAEGRPIRTHAFREPLRKPETARPMTYGSLSADLDRVMTSFFRRLSGDEDPELLAQCFVVTKESEIADQRLARISEDLLGSIKNIDTASSEHLTKVVDRVRTTHRNEFVLLVGTKGAGKSTFIDRFFRYVLPKPILDDCIVATVNLKDSEGNEGALTDWLDQQLLDALESAIFGQIGPTFDEIEGMFFDEYSRWRNGTLHHLYQSDKTAFKVRFGEHIEERREKRPHEYIRGLLRHVVDNRKKVPCLVFDNADHYTIEFQERVFQYARSIYESEVCLVVLPITDRTSWQLSREGALRSFESESLFLPTPSPRTVLRKRVEFLEEKLTEEKREPGRGYFVGRGIHLSIKDLTGFTAALQAIFLRTGEVSEWIGNLANHDIRQCLELAKSLVTSPQLQVQDLIEAYLMSSNIYIPPYRITKAIVRGHHDIYVDAANRFVRNVYALNDEMDSSPLTGLRILGMLQDGQESDPRDPFIAIDQIVGYLQAMHIEPNVTLGWLSPMLESGLCLSYDPTITSINAVGRVELSPSGQQHLRWGTADTNYVQAMLEVTPIADQLAFQRLVNLQQEHRYGMWREELKTFFDYLIAEDSKYCVVPDHSAYIGQKQLAGDLRRILPPA